MKNPLWIITSSLVILLLIVLGVMIITFKPLPSKKSIVVTSIEPQPRQDFSRVNPAQIYENDLFNTTVRIPTKPEEVSEITPMPMPPAPQPAITPSKKQVQFLPPLNVTLKGIMYSANQEQNSAIIADNKTKQEQLYRIGDRIEDADIIYLDRHKIIVLRSNGQQETIFVTAQDAAKDPSYQRSTPWSKVVKNTAPSMYQIDPKAFIKRIPNVSQLIEMLDLTTAYQQGKSLGCMIGVIAPQSIGNALGFESGDIITFINDVPTTTTKDRTTIYQSIKNMTLGDQIVVNVKRQQQELTLTYVIQRISTVEPKIPRIGTTVSMQTESGAAAGLDEQHRVAQAISQDGQRFEKSAKALNVNDRRRMQKNGGKQTLLQRFSDGA